MRRVTGDKRQTILEWANLERKVEPIVLVPKLALCFSCLSRGLRSHE